MSRTLALLVVPLALVGCVGSSLCELPGGPAEVASLAFSQDGGRLAATGRDGSVHVWTLGKYPEDDGTPAPRVLVGPREASGLAFSPDGERLATRHDGPDACRLIEWRVADGARLTEVAIEGRWSATSGALAYAPDGALLAVVTSDTTDTLAITRDGRIEELEGLGVRSAPPGVGPPMATTAFSPDGQWLIVGDRTRSGPLQLWTTRPRGLRQVIEPEDEPDERTTLEAAAFAPDGRLVVCDSDVDALRVWFTEDGRSLDAAAGWKRGEDSIHAIAVDPAGTRAITGGIGGQLSLWSFGEGDLARFEGHAGGVSALAWAPHGGIVASAGREGGHDVVRLWLIPDRKE